MTRVHGPALDAWLAAAARVAPVTITGPLGSDEGPYLELADDSPEPPTFLANFAPRKGTP